MNDQFTVHKLNDGGLEKAQAIAEAFDLLLEKLKKEVPEGRELSLVKTKLEEACFFAKKGMARQNENLI